MGEVPEKKTRKRETWSSVMSTDKGKIIYAKLGDEGRTLRQWCQERNIPQNLVTDILQGTITGERNTKSGKARAVILELERYFGVDFDKSRWR